MLARAVYFKSNIGPARTGCSDVANQTRGPVHYGPGLGWTRAGWAGDGSSHPCTPYQTRPESLRRCGLLA
jgi:hypothetical protein